MKFFAVDKLEQFLCEFDKYKNSGQCYFRGQADANWDITPGLARNKDKRICNQIIEIEQKLFTKFREKVFEKKLNHLIPIIENSYHESWQWLMAAQHYSLPTRLLDFSHDKYTALEFAVADLQKLNADGALIIYCGVNTIQEEITSPILKDVFKPLEKTFFFQAPIFAQHGLNECKLSERRKMIQGSKFLYRGTSNITECLALDDTHSHKLIKIYISKQLKPAIIEYLIEEGRFAFDIYAGKNAIDYHAAILKNEFMNLETKTVDNFLN